MSTSNNHLRPRLRIVALVTMLATSAWASDDELRIGRYQTVRTATQAEPIENSASPTPAASRDALDPCDALLEPEVGPNQDIAPKGADDSVVDQDVNPMDERSDAE